MLEFVGDFDARQRQKDIELMCLPLGEKEARQMREEGMAEETTIYIAC